MNDVASAESSRKRAISPMPMTPTTGQNRTSKSRNAFREAICRFRRAKAPIATSSVRQRSVRQRSVRQRSSARQLNEHLLELGLAHLHVAHDDALGMQGAQDLGEPLLRIVH